MSEASQRDPSERVLLQATARRLLSRATAKARGNETRITPGAITAGRKADACKRVHDAVEQSTHVRTRALQQHHLPVEMEGLSVSSEPSNVTPPISADRQN